MSSKMVRKALKASRRYGQSFYYFTFFSGLSYLLYKIISFYSLGLGYWVIIGVLISCLAIIIPAVEEGLKTNDIKFEEEQAIRLKTKENLLGESLYKVSEAGACLLHPNRYWDKDSWMIGNAYIYLYTVPDFIYEILDIPEDKRVSDQRYYTRDARLAMQSTLNHETTSTRKYRPSEDEVRNAAPALIEFIEKSLKPFVDPLSYPVKAYNDRYMDHICKLIELLKGKEFYEMGIERKVYNKLNP